MNYTEEAKNMINSHKLFQFSANWCPDCDYALSIWKKFNVQDQIHVFDIGFMDKDIQAKWRDAFQEVTGVRNLPTIVSNGTVWGTETRLHEVENSGLLEKALPEMGFKL
ncbi:hypothetical protein RNJ44_04511 [Nakaseomyces bracarensis]|uniref:Glutaredoxin domain-containing protein n=1 Tax=Nakaseomyces bracarensis TaxID=273131 RepID=A0ABR4NV56_9SACH